MAIRRGGGGVELGGSGSGRESGEMAVGREKEEDMDIEEEEREGKEREGEEREEKQQPSVSYASIYTLDSLVTTSPQIDSSKSTSMADPSPQSATPSPALQSPTSEPPPPPPPCSVFPSLKGLNRPKLRVTSEFDSDTLLFFNKVSCKIFDNLAKLKLSFHNNTQREVSQPQVSFTSKYVSVLYDVEEKNAFVKSTVDVSPRLQLRALHNVKAQQGEVAMEANLAEPGYSLELSSPVPIGYASTISSPRATLKFPLGEVSVQEKEVEEEEKSKRIVSVNGVLKRQAMNGVCSALYTDEELRLRYAYKSGEMAVGREKEEDMEIEEEEREGKEREGEGLIDSSKSTSMADPSPQSATPTPALQSPTSEPPPPPPPCSVFPSLKGLNRPKLRVTSEFDSDSLLFFNKVSCKIFDNLAKLKLSFQNNTQRQVSQPQVSFTSKYVSVLYDVEEKNAFVKSTVDVSPRLQLRALHNVKAQQGEVAMEANLAEPGYSLELSSPVPIGYPRATLKFPLGEVSVQEKEVEEEEKSKRIVSVNGVLKRQAMNGVCSALYTDEELRLRYAYK
ncbi:hypothetical protein F2Q70_00008803, partial [Brassica cretica]